MATGGAVVCTDAHGNRDFCIDGENCLIPEPDAARCQRRIGAAALTTHAARAPRARRDRNGRRLRLATANRCPGALPGRDRGATANRAVHDVVPEPRTRPGASSIRPQTMLEVSPPKFLRCPVCRRASARLRLRADRSDAREVRDGMLLCSACGAELAVQRGVGQLLRRSTRARRARGRRPGALRRAHARRRLGPRHGPAAADIDDGYWYVQATSIQQLWRHGRLPARAVGCWTSVRTRAGRPTASRVRGLQVIALDISLPRRCKACYTADYFIEDGTSYFERVLGSMNDMPIASGSLDYVYCLRGPAPQRQRQPAPDVRGGFRVLKPGGRLLVVNETLKTITDPVGVHPEAVAQFDGYEHAHWAARNTGGRPCRAGFSTRLLEPSYHWFFRYPPRPRKPPLRDWSARLRHELQVASSGATGLPGLGQPRRRRRVVRNDRHQDTPRGPIVRLVGSGGSEILGDARRDPVEHPEAEHEDRHARSRSAPAPPSRWPE